jgi:hypothetical protein
MAYDWRLPEVYDLDTHEAIIDQVAIDRAVAGQRRGDVPWLTRTEAVRAFREMDRLLFEDAKIAEHIGCSERQIHRWRRDKVDGNPAPKPVEPAKKYSAETWEKRREYDRIRSAARRRALREAAFGTSAA